MEIELDYDKDVGIDETALDVEWLGQSTLAHKYIKNLMHLRKVEKRAHEHLKTVRSDLIHKVNEDPGETVGKAKPNAADIEAYYRRSDGYKEAKEEWINAEYEADYAELVQKEISYGRKASLENLVILHGQQYFAGPKVPRDLHKEIENRREEKRKTSNSKVKIKRRK